MRKIVLFVISDFGFFFFVFLFFFLGGGPLIMVNIIHKQGPIYLPPVRRNVKNFKSGVK